MLEMLPGETELDFWCDKNQQSAHEVLKWVEEERVSGGRGIGFGGKGGGRGREQNGQRKAINETLQPPL